MDEQRKLFDNAVLVVDALGLSNEMKSTDGAGLLRIVEKLDRQYHEFRANALSVWAVATYIRGRTCQRFSPLDLLVT